jgi:hypothetical protein
MGNFKGKSLFARFSVFTIHKYCRRSMDRHTMGEQQLLGMVESDEMRSAVRGQYRCLRVWRWDESKAPR